MNQVAEPFIRRRAIRHLEKGRVVVFAGGTGNPYFSTDTAASLRAMEIKADAILKATKVDGIYTADPVLVKDATMFDQISYMDVLRLGLRVMDATAIAMCRENNLPIVIFNLNQHGNIHRVVMGETRGLAGVSGLAVRQTLLQSERAIGSSRQRVSRSHRRAISCRCC